ncbi:MAG: Gfo/Idh/MocA family protein [Planctomycetota bacterium]|jgi:predicted dehydrogenase
MVVSIPEHLDYERVLRVGFVGCGSHAFRNIYAALQFLPVRLAAVCDLDVKRAEAFARQFGAEAAYGSVDELLTHDDLDAVIIVTNYDDRGRPRYPEIAQQALAAGKHVWMEKPPAATTAEIEAMQAAAKSAGKNVVVGFKKMFAPANQKAKELIDAPDFGAVSLATFQYPLHLPTPEEMARYFGDLDKLGAGGQAVSEVTDFLDHLCHPVSLMLMLLGMPKTLTYQAGPNRAGAATFTFESGAVATIAMSAGLPMTSEFERTLLVGDGQAVTIENNIRVTLHRQPGLGYGNEPDFFTPGLEGASFIWEPEFSLGQLYNKGLFLLGYWHGLNEFTTSILESRPPTMATLQHAHQATQILQAFAQGPGKIIEL